MSALLVADVGGTHARIGLVGADFRLVRSEVSATRSITSAQLWIDDYLDRAHTPIRGACIAIAGPVSGGVGRLTNGALTFDADALELPCTEVAVVNDFIAAALGVPMLPAAALVAIGDGQPRAGTKAVIGPGTGLGMGILVAEAGGYRALPSEGGHGDLAATNPLEQEVYQHLGAALPFVSWESVLSGPGLVNLYRAVCAVWGCAAEEYSAPDITRLAADATDPVCHQTVELFCNLLGGAAGNLAITVCAEGGVYLCGGMVPALLPMLTSSQFRRRFESRGPMTEYVRPMATLAVVSADLGLLGAAAAHRAQFGRRD